MSSNLPAFVIVRNLTKETLSLGGIVQIPPNVESTVAIEPIHDLHKTKVFTSLCMAIERKLLEVLGLPADFAPEDLEAPEAPVQQVAWPKPDALRQQAPNAVAAGAEVVKEPEAPAATFTNEQLLASAPKNVNPVPPVLTGYVLPEEAKKETLGAPEAPVHPIEALENTALPVVKALEPSATDAEAALPVATDAPVGIRPIHQAEPEVEPAADQPVTTEVTAEVPKASKSAILDL